MNPLTIIDACTTETPQVAVPSAPQATGRVTLLRLPTVSHALAVSSQTVPPIGIAYLAAVLERAGYTVSLIDTVAESMEQIAADGPFRIRGLNVEALAERMPPDTRVIGISSMFSQEWPWHREMIVALRRRFPEALIVVGGEHLSALPEFTLRECPAIDVGVVGEGEETLLELLAARSAGDALDRVPGLAFLRDGQFVQTAARARIRNVDAIPWPAWHLLPMETYLPNPNIHGVYNGGRTMPLLATRGCPYKCTFCTNPSMYGVLYFTRKPSDVLDEIAHNMRVYGANNFLFYDLTFVLKRSWVLEFCRLIVERGMEFTWQLPTGTRSEVIDDEVAAALYRTGCRVINFAPESGSQETLKIIKKQIDSEHLIEAVRASLRQGVKVKCMLIIGFPHETRRHVYETWKFACRLAAAGVHDLFVFFYTAQPGGQLFKELVADGTIPAIDDRFFQSLNMFLNPFNSTNYCRHVRPKELVAWRFAIFGSFFALQFLLRPWRVASLLMAPIRNRYQTHTEQRFGQALRRLLGLSITRRAPDGRPATAPVETPEAVGLVPH